MIVVTMKDKLIGAFMPLQCLDEKDGETYFKRVCRGLWYAKDEQLKSYENYELYEVGSFDDETGILKAFEQPKLLGSFESMVDSVINYRANKAGGVDA